MPYSINLELFTSRLMRNRLFTEQQPSLWPIFGSVGGQKSFWDKLKKTVLDPNLGVQLMNTFYRVGKKHTKPKTYCFILDETDQLYYMKSEKDKIPKGKIQLGPQTQIRIELYTYSKNEEAISITFFRNDKTKYQIFSLESDVTFKWFEALRSVCTINNYDQMYVATELLGKGSFASVYRVKRLLDDADYAAKCYYIEGFQMNPQKEKYASMIKSEIETLRSFEHPGLLRIHEVYQQADKIVLVTDLVNGINLYQLIKNNKRLSELHSAVLVLNIARAMATMASRGFAHRDLKLENIIVTSKTILETVILDFGFAERINPNHLQNKAGTPGYIAPEVFEGKPYTEKGDVFSLGVMYYSMVNGKSPFKGKDFKEIMEQNRVAEVTSNKNISQDISDECQQLIKSMMERDPDKRISFAQIIQNQYLTKKVEEFRQKLQQAHPNQLLAVHQPRSNLGQYDSFDFKQRGEQVKSFFKQSMRSSRSPGNQQQQQSSERNSEYAIPEEDGPQPIAKQVVKSKPIQKK